MPSHKRREFCARPDRHPDERLLKLQDFERRRTKGRRPRSNGFIEWFHRTRLEEHRRVKGRTTWYETLEEVQQNLGAYLEQYNTRRPDRGRGMDRKTSYQAFKPGLKKGKRAGGTSGRQEETEAAETTLRLGPSLR